jgi:hypothetical protein
MEARYLGIGNNKLVLAWDASYFEASSGNRESGSGMRSGKTNQAIVTGRNE